MVEYEDGTKYKGGIHNFKKNGYGIIKYPNGEFYEGEFVDDEFEGKGKFVSEQMTYDGCWKMGYAHGKGKEVWKSGAVFQGSFFYGVKTGNGNYLWENGNSYKGTWENDQMNGEGLFRFFNGTVLLGYFENGLLKTKRKIIAKSGENLKNETKI